MYGFSDFGVGNIALYNGFQDIVGWTSVSYHVQVGYGCRKPQPLTALYNVLKPFDLTIWLWLLGVLIAVSVCYTLIYYCYRR